MQKDIVAAGGVHGTLESRLKGTLIEPGVSKRARMKSRIHPVLGKPNLGMGAVQISVRI